MKKDIILFMGSFPPRECGIATFTKDLTDAISKNLSPQLDYGIVAMNVNGTNMYNYPKRVLFEINDRDVNDYLRVAHAINSMPEVKLVNIQHEFGIFGEDYGKNLIHFLEALKKPTVITLHSILPDPELAMKRVVRKLADNSDAFIVMAKRAIEILRKNYGLLNDIFYIPHGIPFVPFEPSIYEKKNLGFQNKIIISSFGMLNKGKGYEYVLDALPQLVKKFPNLMYVIIGETHPVVRKNEGETYRNFLESKVKENGLHGHVKFYNKYVKLHEIIRYLKATDIYISSGLDLNQITSGTLVYAMGAGRPVISTPFEHAKEAVTEDVGRLVEYRNSNSFAEAIEELLSNEELRKRLELNAYHLTRHMTWPNVAIQYEKIFGMHMKMPEWEKKRAPEIKFSHLIKLTDNFGVIQFARNYEPQLKYGYTTDDVSRALVACCMFLRNSGDYSKLNLIKTYLNYLGYVQRKNGKFYNIVNKHKEINYDQWSDDAHGRALWGLGYAIGTKKLPEEMHNLSKEMFNKAIPFTKEMDSTRAMAFSILGSHHYNNYEISSDKLMLIKKLSDNLVKRYNENSDESWAWFEDSLTYDNSKIPESLFYAYLSTGDEKYLHVATSSLDFLNSVSFSNGILMPVGQAGWFKKGGERAYFDQQPIDVGSMVQALVAAYNITGKKIYKDYAFKSFNWFLGKNALNQIMYDDYTGGCYDGIGQNCININQGAESTISYLLARLSIENIKKKQFEFPVLKRILNR